MSEKDRKECVNQKKKKNKKKPHNLKVENYVLFHGLSEDFKPGRQPLRSLSEEVREESEYMSFSTKTRN